MNIKSIIIVSTCLFSASKQISALDSQIAVASAQPRQLQSLTITYPPAIPIHMPVFAEGFCHGLICWYPLLALLSPREAASDILNCFGSYRSFRNNYRATAISLLTRLVKKKGDVVPPACIESYCNLRSAVANNYREHVIRRYIDACNAEIKKHHNLINEDICELHNTAYIRHEYEISRLLGLLIGGSILPLAVISTVCYSINNAPPKPICEEVCTTICTPPKIEDLD